MIFKNKVVLITGASAGFGKATAYAFAKEGATLILVARRKERLEDLAKELQKTCNVSTLVVQLDVSNAEQVSKALKKLPAPFNAPDILINNAGLVRGMDKVWETNPQDCDEIIDTNIKGILNISREVIPGMLERNSGHIINIGSVSGFQTYPGGSVYCASKHAVRAITDALRMELVATPLRVSLVSPGLAETEFSIVRFRGDTQKAKDVYKGIQPLTSEDIAESIIFIASRPPHVNVSDLVVYPTNQASVAHIHRG